MSPSRRRRASPAWEGRPTIRVATIPGRSLYARHLGHPEGVDAVHRTTVGTPGTARPRARFDRHWVADSIADVDVVHVLDLPPGTSPDDIAATADAVRGTGTPLVVTGYHLTDPTGADTRHTARLDALIPRADAVVTLTEAAATQIRDRWDVDPVVLPHPHAVDFVRMRRPRPTTRDERWVVGTHLAGLRLPIDPVRFVAALARAVRGIAGAHLVVHLHQSVVDPGSTAYAPQQVGALRAVLAATAGTLRVHRPFSESQLWDHLFSLDVSVVPGLHGTHSIWPEACADLGTTAVLPAGTAAAQQQSWLTFEAADCSEADPGALADSLGKALWTAREQGPAARCSPEHRWDERVGVAQAHRGIYERLLGWERT